ncbi:MAG: type II toxin-antitoxin system prevent-host-death family antitoxin [Nitrococcus sp.]|nr:type II toxin-antitoxin system prevent-host-death family antitoxin [Nitrococcus sp.]
MEKFDVFSVRDLRNRSGDLLRQAEAGRMSLITKHGTPAILALPFDKHLLRYGVHRALALHLFESRQLTLAQAAKVAEISVEEFVALLAEAGIPAVDYPPGELKEDLDAAL